MWAALAAVAASVLTIALGEGLRDAAVLPWIALLLVGAADAVISLPRGRELTFALPDEVFLGETVPLVLDFSPAVPGLAARPGWPDGVSGPAEARFVPGQGGHARAEIPCRGVRRGTWRIDHVWLLWPSRLGLFEYVPRLPIGAELRVVPNIRLVQSGAITAQVKSALFGVKENRAIGEGSEFHQLREFASGMDVRSIDWKRSARARLLVARELRAERNHHVVIAIDNGYLMREEIGGLPKIDQAVTAALALAWAAAIGGDLVGYYSYDVRPRTYSAPAPGRTAFARMRRWTAELDYVSRETNHTLALTELNARTPKRSLIIIFTDFVDTTSAELLIENVAILAKRHLVVFVTIRDPETDRLLAERPDSLDGVATLVSASQLAGERNLVMERLARLGVTVLDAPPGLVTPRLISTYLEIKARELI